VPAPQTNTRTIEAVLKDYQQAFSALDANAAQVVWPTVDVKALSKAFDQLDEQAFDLQACNVAVAGVRAEAECKGTAQYSRKVGSKALRVEARQWHFRLKQVNDRWVIDAVDAR
jgi:triacylglycerol esterase/lipase EstA (alpha/beta hydrolase family)